MMEFKAGTKVHVEFDAIVEKPNDYDYIKAGSGGDYFSSDYGYGFLKVRDTKGFLYHYVWADPYGENNQVVTVVELTDWEKHGGPQVGDIWEANEREYFAYLSFGHILTLFPVEGSYAGHSYSSYQLDSFAAFNPRLVRRRGESV